MRICLLSREYPPETGWGGIGTFTHHLANGLAALDQDVHVVSLTPGERDAPVSTSTGRITIHRVSPKQLHSNTSLFNFSLPVTRPMLQQTSALWRKFIELHEEAPFDILECAEHFAEGLFPAMARVAPLVVRLHTPHSKLVSERYHNFSPSFDHRVLTMLERLPMLSADTMISPSEDLARYVAGDLNIPLERIHIVRNPVDINHFSPNGPRALAETEAINIVFVGRLEERKGVYQLMEAVPKVMASCPKVNFILIGSDTKTAHGNASVLEELRSMLVSSGAESNVSFIQHVPLNEMPQYYRSADICILPSLYDNAPMTAIEGMACGKPVIGTTAGGTREYVLHDQCGLIVPPADSDALANALISLASDADRRRRMGAFARTHVEANFTREMMAKKTLEHYQKASESFKARQHPSGIYTRPADQLLGDMTSLIDSYEETLYKMMYANSWRTRVKHRAHKGWRTIAGYLQDHWKAK